MTMRGMPTSHTVRVECWVSSRVAATANTRAAAKEV